MNATPSEILSSFTDMVKGRVLDSLGEANVASAFLTGSAAGKDIAVFRDGDTVEIYSDVDLSFVVTNDIDLEDARRRVRALLLDIPLSGDGYRFLAPPDIGVYNESDLRAQSVRPGTVDIPTATVLFGEHDLESYADRFRSSRIDVREALYLIENRLLESMRAREAHATNPSGASLRYAAYVMLKSCVDAVTAVLIRRGEYAASRIERMNRLRDPERGSDIRAMLPDGSIEIIERMDDARDHLEGFLADAATELANQAQLVDRLLLQLWMSVAAHVYGLETPRWDELVMRRCRRGRSKRNLSEVRAIGRRLSVPAARVLLGAARLGAMSPVESLRLTGLAEALDRSAQAAGMRAYTNYLDILTRTFGWREGTIFARGRAMFEATT